MHAFRTAGLAGSVRRRRARRIARHSSRRTEPREEAGAVPVADPFPDIAANVVEAVAVRGKLRDGSNAGEAVGARVVIRKVALVRVAHPTLAGCEFVAPRKEFAGEPAASGKFPLGLRGQA